MKNFTKQYVGREYTPIVETPSRADEWGAYEWIQDLRNGPVAKLLLKSSPRSRPIGIFATTDFLARGLRSYIDSRKGARLRKRVRVIGFGGQEFGVFMRPELSSIKQDYDIIGEQAVEVLFQIINDRRRKFGRGRDVDLSRRTRGWLAWRTGPWYGPTYEQFEISPKYFRRHYSSPTDDPYVPKVSVQNDRFLIYE